MRHALLAIAVASSLTALAPAAPAFAKTSVAQAARVQQWDGRLYEMRGLAGGILGYSLGMDTLGRKAEGMRVKSYVKPWWRRGELVATAIANYKNDHLPVFFAGHSVGADQVTEAVAQLKAAGVPVAGAFYLDPTSNVRCTPGNVARAVEFRNDMIANLGQGFVTLCRDFRGTSQIYTKWIAHVALDDDPVVHSSVLCEMRNAIARSPINVCPAAGWTASLPVIGDLLSLVPSMMPTAPPPASGSRSTPSAAPDRLTRAEPGG